MSDINRLEWLAGQLRTGATTFSNAAQTLRQQAQRLDWSAQDLTSNVNAWAGTGSENFKTAWQTYHGSTQKSASALDNTSQALTKLAQKIEDNVQKMRIAQAAQEASGWLTFGLVILDVVQLGLDPATDAATVGAVGADVTAEAAMTAAEDALVEADLAGAGELGGIEGTIEGVTDSGEIGLDGTGAPGDVPFDKEPIGGDPGGGDPVDVYRVQGGVSRERLLVTPDGNIEIQGDQMLFLNFNQEQRAFDFLARRGDEAYIVHFQVQDEFLQFLREVSVDEREARLFPDRPIRVDQQFPDQFGIRSNLFDELLEYVIPGSAEVILP